MKVYYFNDENVPVTIQVNNWQRDPMKWDHIEYVTIQPQNAKLIILDAPEGSIPYLKRWETRQTLLTYLPASSELLSRRDGEDV